MLPGHTVSHYEIVEKLGRGGMGVVYKARDTRLDRIVALKFLPPHLSADADAKQRFIQEAKAASALDHGNICVIHDIAENANGELYIVMAYYEGQTLKYRLEHEDFSIDDTLDLIRQLAAALDRAHEAGIAHRDLKPANIMVTDRREVKLLDFGLAKLASGSDLTREGSTLGTAAYMSPEQARGEEVDARTDIWSLGVVLYEMLAGRKPFAGEYEHAMMYAILNEEPTPVTELQPAVPEPLANVVKTCLKKDRNDRFTNIAAFIAAVDNTTPRSQAGTGAAATPVSRKVIAVGVVALVALLGLVLYARGVFSGHKQESLSKDVIAILPFTVRGSADLDYLGEGLVDLLSEKLDGAGPLRTIEPRVVISMISKNGLDVSDPDVGERAAARLGAGRYVTGELLEVGGRVRLTAYMHETELLDRQPDEAFAEGDATDLFEVIDGLASKLLSKVLAGPDARLGQLAVSTSTSLEATKEYLRGEKLLRNGLYREAAAAYSRAVELDTSFALAYYKKSVAAEWIDAPDGRALADSAFRHANKLSRRDRDLLAALRHRRSGRIEESELAYRNHLKRYPDEVQALTQIGEILFHDNPRRGRRMLDAREPFERVLALEPGNLISQIHLARLDALESLYDTLAARAAFLGERAPDSERAVEVDAIYAYATRDTAGQISVKDRLRSSPWYYVFYAVHGVSRFARDVHGAVELLDARTSDEPLLLSMIPELLVARGKLQEFAEFMSSDRRPSDPSWDIFEAFVLTSGMVQPSRDRLEILVSRLKSADPVRIRETGFLPPHDDVTREFIAFERDFFVALLLVHLGRIDESRMIADRLDAVPDFPGLGSVKTDALRGLRAEILHRSDDHAGALAELRQMQFQIPHAVTVHAVAELSRARYLRAEIEHEMGDIEVAKGFYRGLDQSWSPYDMYFRAKVYMRLAAIAEVEGRSNEAIRYYNLLMEQWRDCDAALLPERDAVQERLERLIENAIREPNSTESV